MGPLAKYWAWAPVAPKIDAHERSLVDGVVPQSYKAAYVTPLLKKCLIRTEETIVHIKPQNFFFKLQGLIAFRLSHMATLTCAFWHYVYEV